MAGQAPKTKDNKIPASSAKVMSAAPLAAHANNRSKGINVCFLELAIVDIFIKPKKLHLTPTSCQCAACRGVHNYLNATALPEVSLMSAQDFSIAPITLSGMGT